MARIFTSGNYLICDTPNGLREFAKKLTVYHIVGRNLVISEQGDIKLEIPLSEVADYNDEAGTTPYTVATLTTFLRQNTGNFNAALGGSGATTNALVTSGTYTVQPTDFVISANYGAIAAIVYLPTAASCPGRILMVRRESNADSGTFTITASGSDTIEAVAGSFASTFALGTSSTARKAILYSNGVDKWYTLSSG